MCNPKNLLQRTNSAIQQLRCKEQGSDVAMVAFIYGALSISLAASNSKIVDLVWAIRMAPKANAKQQLHLHLKANCTQIEGRHIN